MDYDESIRIERDDSLNFATCVFHGREVLLNIWKIIQLDIANKQLKSIHDIASGSILPNENKSLKSPNFTSMDLPLSITHEDVSFTDVSVSNDLKNTSMVKIIDDKILDVSTEVNNEDASIVFTIDDKNSLKRIKS